MNLIQIISAEASSIISEALGQDVKPDQIQIDQTRKEFVGDFTIVVFPFVKLFKKAPEQVGVMIGDILKERVSGVSGYNVVKGFLNLELTDVFWVSILQNLLDKDALDESNENNTVLVEFSSPNTNKPLHLGHLRNIFLGDAVSALKAFAGNKVIRTQIINDRGVHICKSMLAWQRWGNGETPDSSGLKGDKLVGKYYVIFDQKLKEQIASLVKDGMSEEEAKKEAPLLKEVQEMLVSWESGDPEVVKLWQRLNGWVYEGFGETYQRMGVSFDRLYYESDTYLTGRDMVLDGLEKGLFFKKDNGSVWVDLSEDGLDEKLLLRADGTSVYMTQDIGTAYNRFKDYPDMHQAIYTVGDEQDYHFKVLFLVLEKLGFGWAKNCEHLSYGMVDLPSGKMKSREGTVVDADDLMDEVVNAAMESSLEKGKLDELTEQQQEALYEILGIGALKFFLLRVDPKKRMLFDPQESVSLNGDTGPFVQYTYARCRSVLRKSGDYNFHPIEELHIREKELIKKLSGFASQAKSAADSLNPSIMASYCIDLAKVYNQFYQDVSILKSSESRRGFRLHLTQLTAETIKKSMSLIGIGVPERM